MGIGFSYHQRELVCIVCFHQTVALNLLQDKMGSDSRNVGRRTMCGMGYTARTAKTLMLWFVLLGLVMVCKTTTTPNRVGLVHEQQLLSFLTTSSRAALVVFSMSTSEECDQVIEELEIVAKTFRDSRERIMIGVVDLKYDKPFIERQKVVAFPTIRMYSMSNDGKLQYESYRGQETSQDLIEFVNRKLGLHKTRRRRADHVKELVVDMFDPITSDPIKDVVIILCSDRTQNICQAAMDVGEVLGLTFEAESDRLFLGSCFDPAILRRYALQDNLAVAIHFPRGFDKETILITEMRDQEDLSRFQQDLLDHINESLDTKHVLGGNYDPGYGIIPELQQDIASFTQKTKTSQEQILDHLQSLASEYDETILSIYKKHMTKIIENGNEYLPSELARLDRLISDENLSQNSRNRLLLRRNLLQQFLVNSS